MIEREKFVAFADENMKTAFEKLKEEDPKLHKFISRSIEDLKGSVCRNIDSEKNSFQRFTSRSIMLTTFGNTTCLKLGGCFILLLGIK